jgi:hypothetical protein
MISSDFYVLSEETGGSKNHAADAPVNTVSIEDVEPEDTSSQAPMVIPSKPKYRLAQICACVSFAGTFNPMVYDFQNLFR